MKGENADQLKAGVGDLPYEAEGEDQNKKANLGGMVKEESEKRETSILSSWEKKSQN